VEFCIEETAGCCVVVEEKESRCVGNGENFTVVATGNPPEKRGF
jgi:hypothetical protein